MTKELIKGFTGIEINGVRFSSLKEMLIYMDKQRDHIIDLEKENAELKDYNKKLLQSDIDKQNKIVLLSQKVNDLQKENAELKEQLRLAKEMPYSAVKKFAEEKTQEQLTKAKELLKRYVKIYVNPYPEEEIELRNEAKQFLSEVENESKTLL